MTKTIRLSIGTAALLGLVQCKLDAAPTTAYTMTYTQSRCRANCAFCAQARNSSTNANKLSRVTWPAFSMNQVISTLTENNLQVPFNRLCIQTLYYPSLVNDLSYLVTQFKKRLPQIPISIALPPLPPNQLQSLYNQGVDRVAISLDVVTSDIFERIKGDGVEGPFSWDQHYQALESARRIFGPGRTTTHLIIGLGETEYQTVHLIQDLVNKGITIGLFPFTPLKGTPLAEMERPTLGKYRRIQLAHYLLQNQLVNANQIQFDSSNQLTGFELQKELLTEIIARGKAFQTAGCPSCNRPFFTEPPGGPIYNYPEPPTAEALHEIEYQLAGVL
ncbi:MAG: radical SAM protein [Candidatus Hermodarchaeia archaeon]